MAEKLCVFCKHLNFGCGDYYDYGGETGGGIEGGSSCNKGHFYDELPDTTESLRELITRAATCPDYDQVKP